MTGSGGERGIGVKVCGLTEPLRVDQAVAGGARMVGFVFFPPSPRSLTPDAAAALAARVPESVQKVGVFVDPGDDWLAATVAAASLDIVQLHGFETPARVAEVRARLGVRVMKALRLAEPADLAPLASYRGADLILFDAKPPPRPGAIPGGNGLNFDWRLLDGLRLDLPWVLAGGLDPDNLEDAVRRTGAKLVDVSSGIEIRPGIKDPDRLGAFLRRARELCLQPAGVGGGR
jgi:phosphoribosylanthranilate isomerase